MPAKLVKLPWHPMPCPAPSGISSLCSLRTLRATSVPSSLMTTVIKTRKKVKFSAKLKQLREAAGLTQQQLADRAGLSQSAITLWESGSREPGLEALGKLCAALDVPCTAFIPTPKRRQS